MQRRQFLALAGATLGAGCSGLLRDEREEATETVTPVPVNSVTTASDQASSGEDDEREVPDVDGTPVLDLETGPRTVAIPGRRFDTDRDAVVLHAPDGAVVYVGFTATATADHPATVRAVLVNENDWGNRFRLTDVPAFDGVNHATVRQNEFDRRFDGGSDDEQTGLYLVPTAGHDLVDEYPAVERGPEGYWRAEPIPAELPDRVTLAAGDFVLGEYYVVGHWDRTGFPTGTYAFAEHGDGFGLSVWDATVPGPPTSSRFRGRARSLPHDDATPWYHEADATTTVFLEPDHERVTPPARISFRLVNHSREWLTGNPHYCALYKQVDGTWYEAVPRDVPTPSAVLAPGETHTYALSLFHRPGFDAADEHADLSTSVDRIGGGRYAFASGFSADGAAAPAAIFDVDAPPISLSVPDDAERSRVDDQIVITLPEWYDDTDSPGATLTLREIDGGAVETVIRELVARESMRALESALAAIDDAEGVFVRANKRLVENVTGAGSTLRRFSFEGETYLATARYED